MTALYLLDDAAARRFAPFALTRPAAELRAGTLLIRERWEHALGMKAVGTISAGHLADFEEPGAPPVERGTIPAGAILANARCVVRLERLPNDGRTWMCNERIAAVRLDRPVQAAAFDDGSLTMDALSIRTGPSAAVEGRWLDAIWDLVTQLPAQLAEDIGAVGPSLACTRAEGHQVLGSYPVYLEQGATVEPYVVFDATQGPILVRAGATIRAFTRVVGPCAIGGATTILGDRVACCSIGEGCMVRGEISESIIIGNANKAHEGFVGHSVLGRWVNLGAGTTTSNLKNTYGPVALATPDGLRDTGALKLGTFFGDHVKTGIGLCLTTGTVIGAGSNLYGSAMPPKSVPAFSWGEGSTLTRYALDKFLATAERAMGRRGVRLGARARRQLETAHAMAAER